MLQISISLTTLAIILWSGMLVIAGSIWILASQVRKIADLLEPLERRRQALEVLPPRLRPDRPRIGTLLNAQARLDEIYAAREN